MRRRFLAAGGLVLAAGLAAHAQPPAPAVPGYLVIRVNLAVAGGELASPPGGSEGGSTYPGGSGPMPPGFPGPRGAGAAPAPAGGPAAEDPSRTVAVVVPYKRTYKRHLFPKKSPHPDRNPTFDAVDTEFGTTLLYADKKAVQLYPLTKGFSLPNLVKQHHQAWAKTHAPQAGFDLVAEALSYGLVDEAFKFADETTKAAAAIKDRPLPPAVAAFVKAFGEVQQRLTDPTPDDGSAARWQSTLNAAGVEQSNHYALVHWGDQSVSREALDRRLKLLEGNFRAFYLWHALGGVAVKPPEKKLVVVLADKVTDMPRLRDALDGQPIVSDGFYAPTHNLVVLSPERMDDAGRSFGHIAQNKYKVGWNREDLLKGKSPDLQGSETAVDAAYVMTLALVDRLVDEDAAVAMVTREGSRQLYAASGLMAQHVIMPEWVENGAANLLHKPKGPFYSTDNGKPMMTVGLASGYGSPNYVLVRQFRELLAKKELNPKADELLTNTLLDKYFDAAREGRDIDPPPEKPGAGGVAVGGPGPMPGGTPGYPGSGPPGYPGSGPPPGYPGSGPPPGYPGSGPPGYPGVTPAGGAPQPDPFVEARTLRDRVASKAQVTSWALTYYLTQKKLAALIRFYDELNRMPRDMRLDRDRVRLSFCRQFGLVDANDPTKVDAAAYKRFADDWVEFLKSKAAWGVTFPVTAATNDPGQGGGINTGGLTPPGYGPMGPGGGQYPGNSN